MRKLKFRVWDIEDKIWVENFGKYLTDGYTKTEEEPTILEILSSDSSFDISQFTGLVDKKNKEIFEGDVVLVPNMNYDPSNGDNPKVINQIWWDKGAFFCGQELLSEWIGDDIEIIGNIYENPELIK